MSVFVPSTAFSERMGRPLPQRRDPTAYFNFGFTASLCGESTAYCPYPKGSDESLSWQRGYDEAEYANRS